MNSPIDNLAARIDQCLLSDRHELRKILAAIRRNADRGKPWDRLQQRFEERAVRSETVVQLRSAESVKPLYDDSLPVCARKSEILEVLGKHQVVILAGETGSGKTTQLPKFCLEMGRGRFGLIGHTQPRRLAARAVANRIAGELQSAPGGLVGYQVRFSDSLSEQTRVKLMTDGVLLAEIQNDPLLQRYDTLIIDEAHERSLNIDFLLGYLKRILPRRPDLKLIITSATIDLERFSRHFDNAPIMEVSGRTYPVEVVWRPLEEMRQSVDGQEKDLDLQQAVVQAVVEVEQLERSRGLRSRGDILVFLSGEREIRETAEALRKKQFRDTEVLPLYARLSNAEQNRIFQPSGRGRRIVLSTNVAETSLTVPGIRYVIDPGQARISRYSYRSKVQRLPVEAISRASANQRKGRCGRVAEGVCIRLFSEEDFNGRPAFTDAEILRTSLAAVILQMEGLKLGKVEDFPFIDPPDPRFVKDGIRLLQELGALDLQGRLTSVGRKLSRLPVDPRIGRMILEAARNNCLSEVLVIASALSIQDPRERPLDKQQQADEKHRQHVDKDSDFIGFVNLWNHYEEQRQLLSNSQLRNYCRKQFLAFMRMREWRDLHRQLHLACKALGLKENSEAASYAAIHKSLLAGLLSHVGLKQEDREYLGARNRKFMIFPGSALAKAKARWIMAAELVETSRLYARGVARIEPGWLEPLAQHLIKRSWSEPHWERKPAQVVALEKQTLYGLPVVAGRKVHYGKIDPEVSQQIFIRSALVEGDFQTRAPFFQHNRQLLAEVQALEDKSRRRDIVIDEDQLYEFYREKLLVNNADKVVNGASFEKWRKSLEQSDPEALFVSREQLMQHEAESVNAVQYPDSFEWKGMSFRLSYHFEPGADNDGVSLTAPVGALSHLPQKRLEWLVPGMLKEKCIALLKGLPKQLRKNFVPIPDYVDAFLEASTPEDIALTEALAIALKKMTGVVIPADAWDQERLEAHHRLRYRILDERGEPLTEGRDWQALNKVFGGRQHLPVEDNSGLERENIVAWDFGDLPEQLELNQAGMKVLAWPALAAEKDGIAVRVFDNPLQAELSHRLGLVRLMQLQIPQQIRHLRKSLKNWNRNALMFAKTGSQSALWDDFVDALTARLFFSGESLPRSRAQFESSLTENLGEFHRKGEQLSLLLAEILSTYQSLMKQLSGNVSLDAVTILNDMRGQLSQLVYPGFLYQTPQVWLDRYVIYFRAVEQRLEKYRRDMNQQRFYSEQLGQFWSRYISQNKQSVSDGALYLTLQDYRWMLEEYRVSLFAQQLGTVVPVSAKRLEKKWQECLRIGS